MKKSVKSLLTLLLLLGVTLEMKAADVYLLTSQTINGAVGKYEVPSNHKLDPNTPGSNVYSLKITSMPETGFWFRIGVSGWSNQMQPTVNDDLLTINEEGTQNPTSYSIESDCYGSSNAWKVSYTAGEYEYLTVNVDITEDPTRRVWIEGKKKTSAGGSDEPVVWSLTDVEPGYYLVGNFFSEHNVGGDVNPGGDRDTIEYTKHVYFKFEQQKDKSYAFSIPACLTAHAKILAVDDYDNKMVYGPGEVVKLHGAKNYTSASPLTNGAVGTICGTTTKALVGSETLAENGNYWDLETRNDGETDDDGMYTFSFTLDGDGNPSDWQVKHDATTRVSYILGDMEGATAQPLFDKRISGGNTGRYSDNNVASLYFNGRNNYWCIGYVVNNLNIDNAKDQYEQAIKATPDIHVTASVNANHDDNSATHDKLFFLGNGGYPYNTNDNRNKVRPNEKPFTLHLYGTKRVVFNANKGDNDLAKKDGSYGMSAEIQLKGDNDKADFTITTMSMIGDAVEGTYDAKTGSWNYTSKAGDMEYDANERCFSLTISTEDEKYDTPHYFRFVANHSAEQNWGETDDNVTRNTGLARSRYYGEDDDHHTCMADDANDVQYRNTARGETEADSEIRTDILWNRPAGIWRIKFYPELDKDNNDVSYYTISGTKVVKMPFTYRVGRFIRTYSNSVAMAPAKNNVKVYAAYKYEPPKEVNDCYSKGKVYLRELKYIPANMGVVLVGEVPADKVPAGGYLDGAKVNFYLEETDDLYPENNYEKLWIKADDYVAKGDKWNNYLKPTVTPIDKLGNADTDENGTIAHRYFGLGNFHSTKYYKQTGTGEDYIGFFRFTENGKSGANKAYLSIPANVVVDGGVGATYGFIDYNGQLLGNVADTNNNQSLAKMAVIFDDEDNGGTTTAVREVKMDTADADASFYTLQGVKVSRPVKGVYIHNGKKFIK